MSAAMPEVTVMPERAPDAPDAQDGPFCRRQRVRFSSEQQEVFNREIKKAKEKTRREHEEREAKLRSDIRELIWAAEQLLFKRLSRQQQQDIARGLTEIKREYAPTEGRNDVGNDRATG